MAVKKKVKTKVVNKIIKTYLIKWYNSNNKMLILII